MTKAGEKLIKSAQNALAFARGEITDGFVLHTPEMIELRQMRKKLGMSQSQFSKAFQIPVRTVQDWEQGKRYPEGPARVLLKVIEHNPKAVLKALEAA